MFRSSGMRWRNSCHGSCDCTQSASCASDIVAEGGELNGAVFGPVAWLVIIGVDVVRVNWGRVGVMGGCADFERQEISVCRAVGCMTKTEGRDASEVVLFVVREWLRRG